MSPVPEESTFDGKQSPRLEDNYAEEDVTDEADYDEGLDYGNAEEFYNYDDNYDDNYDFDD